VPPIRNPIPAQNMAMPTCHRSFLPSSERIGDQFGRLFDVALDTFVNMDRSDIVIIERELDLVVMTMKAWASAKFKFNANRIHRYSFMDGLSYFAWGPPGETTSG
jgi:hypothetical protein